jgi:hypothetical protein
MTRLVDFMAEVTIPFSYVSPSFSMAFRMSELEVQIMCLYSQQLPSMDSNPNKMVCSIR